MNRPRSLRWRTERSTSESPVHVVVHLPNQPYHLSKRSQMVRLRSGNVRTIVKWCHLRTVVLGITHVVFPWRLRVCVFDVVDSYSNEELIAINQDALGSPVRSITF